MGTCSNISPVDKCLAFIAHGVDALQDGNFTMAEGAFRVALAGAKALPPEQGRDLNATSTFEYESAPRKAES